VCVEIEISETRMWIAEAAFHDVQRWRVRLGAGAAGAAAERLRVGLEFSAVLTLVVEYVLVAVLVTVLGAVGVGLESLDTKVGEPRTMLRSCWGRVNSTNGACKGVDSARAGAGVPTSVSRGVLLQSLVVSGPCALRR
jgi:hypothetical protein